MNQDKTTEQAAEVSKADYQAQLETIIHEANHNGQRIFQVFPEIMELWQSYADQQTATLTSTIEAQREVIERYRSALSIIEQYSDPGDMGYAIVSMKVIASKALTPPSPLNK